MRAIVYYIVAFCYKIKCYWSKFITGILFYLYNIRHEKYRTIGTPFIRIMRGEGQWILIGNNFAMNNGVLGNPIGCNESCQFIVGGNGLITIADNVGISQTAIVSYAPIKIGSNVKIGGGTCIWTTDFHSLDASIRRSSDDLKHRKCSPVTICDNVFVGAKSIILKGVTIGENSIIGAGSVVTKNVPPNEIWAGNPAKFIRKI